MSARKKAETETAEEPRSLTASQLFDKYMKTVEKARKLAQKLAVETAAAERLAAELEERFGVRVGPPQPRRKEQPPTEEPLRNEGDSDAPAIPVTTPAPHLAAKESSEVVEIRREAGLSPEEQEDSEALAADAGQRMAELQQAMGGKPAVIPSPGAVEGAPAPPDPGPDNQEGGPVVQRPVEEGK